MRKRGDINGGLAASLVRRLHGGEDFHGSIDGGTTVRKLDFFPKRERTEPEGKNREELNLY